MLKLILDQDFVRVPPAVDSSSYGHHGAIRDLLHHADGSSAGSGALEFAATDASVRIAARKPWQTLGGLAIEARVLVRPGPGRRNIVEGDGSFALYLDADDTVVGSVFAATDGSPAPAWSQVSSAQDSPDGVTRRVPIDAWCRIVYHHDGITRARLFIDEELVATRSDYRSGVGPVAGAGVVIGNWTLSSQFPFVGMIDRIRIWKHEEDAVLRNFNARDADPKTRDRWDDWMACLADRAGSGEIAQGLANYIDILKDFVRDMVRVLHGAEGADRDRLLKALEAYKRNWSANTIDDQSQIEALEVLFRYVRDRLGPGWEADFRGALEGLRQHLGEVDCIDPDELTRIDPAFAGFIAQAMPVFEARS